MSNEFPKMTGTCKYCGQSKILQTVGDISQKEADERASLECDCTEAKKMQNRQSKINKANKWVEGYFENCPELISLFKVVFDSVANNDVDKVSIKRGERTHSIFLDSDGYLTIKSSKKVEEEESFL